MLQWQLPQGFTIGETQWPQPEKLKTSYLADYGYKDDVMLLAALRGPQGSAGKQKAEIGLQAKWLVCREVCIPERATLHLSLPYSSNAAVDDASHAALFSRTEKLIPKAWPKRWQARAVSRKDDFVLSIIAGRPLAGAEFFPLEPNQIENVARQEFKATARGGTLTLKKSDQLLKPIAVLKGVLVLANGQSYEIRSLVREK